MLSPGLLEFCKQLGWIPHRAFYKRSGNAIEVKWKKFKLVPELYCMVIISNTFFRNLQSVIFSVEEKIIKKRWEFKTG